MAVKVVGHISHEKCRRAVENEALFMEACNHPCILRVVGVVHYPGKASIVLELASRGPLSNIILDLKNFPHIPLSLRVWCLIDICRGLEHIHSKKIFHNDIKPENILVCHDFRCKITDFGIAKELTSSTLGIPSKIGGTLHYMAPELKLGQGGNHRSDVYSFGKTSTVLLQRKVPQMSTEFRRLIDDTVCLLPVDVRNLMEVYLLNVLEPDVKCRASAADCCDFLKPIGEALRGDPRDHFQEHPDKEVVRSLDMKAYDLFITSVISVKMDGIVLEDNADQNNSPKKEKKQKMIETFFEWFVKADVEEENAQEYAQRLVTKKIPSLQKFGRLVMERGINFFDFDDVDENDILRALRRDCFLESGEAEKQERERLEKERLEKERLEAEKQERERLEKERLEKERLEAERKERERLVRTDSDIKEAVNLWCEDENRATSTYGRIDQWDVSRVSNMKDLFKKQKDFNCDISSWDVGNVVNMSYMFCNASSFNQDLSSWDVGNVENMSYMFCNASSFNQDLSSWDVGNVKNMSHMFHGASSFNQDLSSWDVGNVKDMSCMFCDSSSFNQDLSSWDVGNVKNMSCMFGGESSFDQDLSSWDVGNVKNMSDMFHGASSFDQDLRSWNVGNVKSMSSMFCDSSSFNQDLSSWDVGNVKDMSCMFCDSSSFDQDLSSWDVGNVENMFYMFCDSSSFDQDLSSWDVGNVVNMSCMFGGASSFNQDLSSWDVGNVENMSCMFGGASSFNQDLSSWDVGNVENMFGMFCDSSSFDQDLSSWDVGNVENMFGMFCDSSSFDQDLSSWDVGNVKDLSCMFHCASSFNQDLSSWDVGNVENMSYMFNGSAVKESHKCHVKT